MATVTDEQRYINDLYEECLLEFQKRFKENENEAISALSPELSDRTVKNILNDVFPEKTKDRFSGTKLAIIDFIWPQQSPRLYHRFERAIGQDEKDVARLFDRGILSKENPSDDIAKVNLRYFRFLRVKDEYGNVTFRQLSGYINIRNKRGITYFSHTVEDKNEKLHDGFVFINEDRMTMLGWRKKVLRLAIIKIPPTKWNAEKDILFGGVASVTRDGSTVHLSKAIIVGEKHPLYHKKISDQKLKKMVQDIEASQYGIISF